MGASPQEPSYLLPVYIQLLPLISFLSIFTRPQDFSSLPRKYQKFSWGLRPQSPDHLRYPSCLHSTMPPDPLINPSSNIQHLPLIYPSYRHSPDPKISSLIMLLEGCDKYMDKKTVLIRCRYFQMYMYIVRLRCTFVDIMCTFMYV